MTQNKKVVALYRKGYTTIEIGEMFNKSREWARMILVEEGEPRLHNRLTAKRYTIICKGCKKKFEVIECKKNRKYCSTGCRVVKELPKKSRCSFCRKMRPGKDFYTRRTPIGSLVYQSVCKPCRQEYYRQKRLNK